ncbi:MAG: ATP-binding protein [bacterium]|nr:ATP-binding protein [bacterium]
MENLNTNGTLGFVETKFSKRVWQTIDYAKKYNKITFIFGESQIGKTTAIREYCRRKKGSAHYVRMPSSPSLRLFVFEVADVLGAPERMTFPARRRYIMRHLSPEDVLIVDEAHQAIMTDRNITVSHGKIFEFLREVYDACGCGLTLCSTNVFEREISNGNLAGVMEQSRRRSLVELHCPALPSAGDLAKFEAAFGLQEITEEAKAVRSEVVKRERLGVWLTILRMATAIAAGQGRAISWADVVQAKRERDAYNAR